MSLRLIRQNLPNKPGGIGVLANGLWRCDGVSTPLSREIPDGFDDRRDRTRWSSIVWLNALDC